VRRGGRQDHGAGGGGFLLLYCEEEHQPAVREAFSAQGIREMRFGFDVAGTRVLVHDPESAEMEVELPARGVPLLTQETFADGKT
jgi:hypothetical protein